MIYKIFMNGATFEKNKWEVLTELNATVASYRSRAQAIRKADQLNKAAAKRLTAKK